MPEVLTFINTCGAVTTADLALQMSGPPTVSNGDTFAYTVTVTNHGPDVAITSSSAMPFRSGMTLIAGSATQGSCSTGRL